MSPDIKTIEDLSLNAWPSHQMQVYDGWILRFSYYYTHRTNCVERIGASSLPFDEKIRYCEEIYRRWQTPCVFKISPLTEEGLDDMLKDRSYRIEHRIHNMTCSIYGNVRPSITETPLPLTLEDHVSEKSLSGLFTLKNTTNADHLRVVPSMYAAIPKDLIAVSAWDEQGIAATGLGILDRDYIGIYAIHVADRARRMGVASSICQTLISEGGHRGARRAYLQVVADNTPAITLYEKLGFSALYSCWFRVREV